MKIFGKESFSFINSYLFASDPTRSQSFDLTPTRDDLDKRRRLPQRLLRRTESPTEPRIARFEPVSQSRLFDGDVRDRGGRGARPGDARHGGAEEEEGPAGGVGVGEEVGFRGLLF